MGGAGGPWFYAILGGPLFYAIWLGGPWSPQPNAIKQWCNQTNIYIVLEHMQTAQSTLGSLLALLPGPCPASRRLQYCKQREAGWGPGSKANNDPRVDCAVCMCSRTIYILVWLHHCFMAFGWRGHGPPAPPIPTPMNFIRSILLEAVTVQCIYYWLNF